jgi:hypothetical protein
VCADSCSDGRMNESTFYDITDQEPLEHYQDLYE